MLDRLPGSGLGGLAGFAGLAVFTGGGGIKGFAGRAAAGRGPTDFGAVLGVGLRFVVLV